MVASLPKGSEVANRFRVEDVLGRGGFSIVYDVHDLRRGDRAVLKELVPPGAHREGNGVIELGPSASTLRHTFLGEAQTVGRLAIPGILPVRLAFVANGTAYVATDAVLGARTLDALLLGSGPLDATGVLDLGYQLLETLEAVHRRGLLHRDVKPSNVLVGRDGRAYLLDFGAARAWSADANDAHTVMFTPGYAPPEQRTALGRRGPSTDVYGLCATLYAALTGRAPTDASARAAGEALMPLTGFREDLDRGLVEAIEAGLSLRPADRPASMVALRRLLDDGPGGDALDTLESLDALLLRSQRFTFDRRACPVCPGVLEEARPLPKDRCPVCRRGKVRFRRLDPRLCPTCRHGVLARPCGEGAFVCDTCASRLEPRPDGRLRETTTLRELYPAEWWRVAVGLDPSAGDAFCDACDADYHRHGDRLTLLHAAEDPHGFAGAYRGRPLSRERVRWLAVGKSSPQVGLVCDRCQTELDHVGRMLELVRSPNLRLERIAGETRSLESWHRVAEGLPEAGRESEIEDRIASALAAAYRRGEVGFGDSDWSGPAEFMGRTTTLIAKDEGFRLGRGLRVRRFPLADLSGLRAEGDTILAEGPDGPFEVWVEPVELVAHLRSGDRSARLTAADLVARLVWTLHLPERFRVGWSSVDALDLPPK